MSFSADEVRFLAQSEREIAEMTADLDLSKKSMISDVATLRKHFGDFGRAVAELAGARRSAVGKLPQDWLMCQESAQQTTQVGGKRS